MKGAVSICLVFCIGLAVANPWNSNQDHSNKNSRPRHDIDEESFYPSGRTRPVSPHKSPNSVVPSPYFYLREPRYAPFNNEEEYLGPRARKYQLRVLKKQRDSDEEEDDEVADDDDEDDDDAEDDVEFDTPSWDEMFPPGKTGSYGQASSEPSGYSSSGSSSPSSGIQYSSGSLQGFASPGSEYEGESNAITPQRRWSLFGRGRSNVPYSHGGRYQKVHSGPVAVRVVRPRQHNWMNPTVKVKNVNRWAGPEGYSRGRQYHGGMNGYSQAFNYNRGYAPVSSRRWAYQPSQESRPQIFYRQKPVPVHYSAPKWNRGGPVPMKRNWEYSPKPTYYNNRPDYDSWNQSPYWHKK